MRKQLVRRSVAALATVLIVASATPAVAGDAVEGKKIISQWCVTCHLTDGNRSASDVGPPFAQIAKDPAYTDERLRSWLHEPHPPMPNFELSKPTIENIIAYIRSLKN